MKEEFFFDELPADVKLVVLQGVKFRLSREPLPQAAGLIDLGVLLDEEADDIINRHNWRRTIKKWIEFAETGT